MFSIVILGMYLKALPMLVVYSTTETHPPPYSGLCSMSGSVIYFTGFNHDFLLLEGHIMWLSVKITNEDVGADSIFFLGTLQPISHSS